jgi:hypothetical protein
MSFENEDDVARRDRENALASGDTSIYDWVLENDLFMNDGFPSWDELNMLDQQALEDLIFDQDWDRVQGGGLTADDQDRQIDQISNDYTAMRGAGMSRVGGQDPRVGGKSGASNSQKKISDLLKMLTQAGGGAAAIAEALGKNPSYMQRATGVAPSSKYTNPYYNIKGAASGGLMTLAAGGSTDYTAYLDANPDVAAAVARGDMTAEQHYTNYGQYEGRDLGGSTSGAQSHFWDSDAWQGLPGNSGGSNVLGIRPGSAPAPNLSNIPNDASFYRAGAEFEGNRFNVGLGAGQMENLQSMLNSGMSYNEAVIRLSGDGIGTEVFMPRESGYLPYGIDLSTGRPIYSHSTSGGGGGGGGGGGDTTQPPPNTQQPPAQPPPVNPGGDNTNPNPTYDGANVTTRSPYDYSQYTRPYELLRTAPRILPEGLRPGSAWNRGGGQAVYTPIRAAAGGIMGLQGQSNLGRYAGGGLGRLVQGPGDGVSDSIPAMIDGQQPALIAQGEYVMPARAVSELGNGSTEAGAARLDQMVSQIEALGKRAGRGKDSGASRILG